jgi:hypothetical protein
MGGVPLLESAFTYIVVTRRARFDGLVKKVKNKCSGCTAKRCSLL